MAGIAALCIYLLTLNHWVSLYSLGTVGRLSGWAWQPELDQPLQAIFFSPLYLLPASWIPLTSNLLTALCSALVLALLARSVALLPHDQPPERRFGPPRPAAVLSEPGAWIPPAFAVILCGLQLSFWEHATSATGEMFDLLLQAAVIWCLFEYRNNRREPWLSHAVLIYAAGIANNWAMIGYLPVFIAALIWLKGYSAFLESKFLGRMALCALAGLSLYLLLPGVQSLFGHSNLGFGDALRLHLRSQKLALGCIHQRAFKMLALASLVPMLMVAIPWKSHTVQLSDDSRLGVFLTKGTVHLVQGLCLCFCTWIALDPGFSPRNLNLGTPMLGYYYLWTLAAGFCAGHFLIFGATGAQNPQTSRRPALNFGLILLCVVSAVLLWRNLGPIRSANGPRLRAFARQMCDDLPAGQSVALSDDPQSLFLLQAEAARRRDGKQPLLIEAPSLLAFDYRDFIARRAGRRWPLPPPTNRLETVGPGKLLRLMSEFASREPVVYLHPANGFYFENFVPNPQGLLQLLAPRADTQPATPSLQPDLVDSNERLWQSRWTQCLSSLAAGTREAPAPSRAGPGLDSGSLKLGRQQTFTSSYLGARYARALDDWGVVLQRLGRWTNAGAWFQRALELDPSSISARINLLYNQRRSHGDTNRLDPVTVQRDLSSLFFRFSNWRSVLDNHGPVDEPSFLFRSARIAQARGESRQAITGFLRCSELAPDWAAPILWRAEALLDQANYQEALAASELAAPLIESTNSADLSELLQSRALALFGLQKTNEAVAFIQSFTAAHPREVPILGTAADLCELCGRFEDELAIVNELLQSDPFRPEFLAKKGFAELRLERFDAAVATLTLALERAPADDHSRLYRAVANLSAGRLEAARPDFEKVLEKPALAPQAAFGLGSIAWTNRDTNMALLYYRRSLSNSPPNSRQAKLAADRIHDLGDRAPDKARSQ